MTSGHLHNVRNFESATLPGVHNNGKMNVEALCDFRVWIAGCSEKASLAALNYTFIGYQSVQGLATLMFLLYRVGVLRRTFKKMDAILLCTTMYLIIRSISMYTMLARALPFQAVLLLDVTANMFAGLNCDLFSKILTEIYVRDTDTPSFIPRSVLEKLLYAYSMTVQLGFMVIAVWQCFPTSLEQYVVLRRTYLIVTPVLLTNAGWMTYKWVVHIISSMTVKQQAPSQTHGGTAVDMSVETGGRASKVPQRTATGTLPQSGSVRPRHPSEELRIVIYLSLFTYNFLSTLLFLAVVTTIERFSELPEYNIAMTVVYNVQTFVCTGYQMYMVIRKAR